MKTRKGHKTYPLTLAQRFHYFYSAMSPGKEILNIGTCLVIGTDLDFDELKRSIYQAYERCESMRVRFAFDKKENKWYQYVVEKEERDIEFHDFSNVSLEEADAAMTEWTRIPFAEEDSPMNRVVMIKLCDGYQGMYFAGDHRLVDAQSLIGFFKDVIEIYCHESFENVPAPSDNYSYIEQVKKDLEYEGSKAQERDRAYFHKIIEESEPTCTTLFGKPFKPVDSMTAAIDEFHLEEEPTKRLMDFCIQENVSLQCLLIMGIRTYLQKVNDTDDISINVAYARRATLPEKKSGGTRIHSFPFRTIIDKSLSFRDGIHEIQKKQNETFRHVNFDPTEYFAHRAKTYPEHARINYEPVNLTYQPASLRDKGLADIGDIKYRTKRYCNGLTSSLLYLTVSHRPDDNGLDFLFEHKVEHITREEIENFYYYLCRILFKGIEAPTLSIDDVIKLT